MVKQGISKWAMLVAGILMSMGIIFYARDFYMLSPSRARPPPPPHGDGKGLDGSESLRPENVPKDLPGLIKALWEPAIHPLDDTHFKTLEGYDYNIPADAYRWKPLGKKLLIVDIDTRMKNAPGDIMNPNPLDYKNMTRGTAGWMGHYLYSMIHGYDYRLVRAPEYPDRHNTWVKVPVIKEALKTHEIVVFLDADAMFEYPHLPFEWLMSLWKFNQESLVAMAHDPDSTRNRDSKGLVMFNTGFIIAQQSNRTQEMFERWDRCPTGERWEGCPHWDKDWAHEQAAFSEHVRYDYMDEGANTTASTKDIIAIPCMDGNGAPYIGDKTCGGVFIRHHWFRKHLSIDNLKNAILDLTIRRLHGNFHASLDTYFNDAHEEKYPLDLHI